MGKRRAREGCIWKLPDGRWRGAVSLGYENGKHIRKWVMRKTCKEVDKAIKELVRKKEANLPIISTRRTVGMFITNWLADEVKPNRSVGTLRIYEQICRTHLIPQLGRIRLSELNGLDVQKCMNQAAEHLSPSSVKLVNTILRTALRTGERWGVVAGNAAKHATLPKQVKFDAKPLTAEQANHLLETVKDDRYGAVFTVALSLGLRHGEIAGLRWESVNFATGRLKVTHQLKRVARKGVVLSELKTKHAKRSLRMPQFVVDALLRRQLIQEQEHINAGDRWKDTGFVFTSRHGDPMVPEKMTLDHIAALKRAKLPRIRFHDLRHSCATLLLSKGVPIKMIQEILGHSSYTTTMNLYVHVVEAMRDEATNAMNDIFDSQKNPVVAPVVAFGVSETIQ